MTEVSAARTGMAGVETITQAGEVRSARLESLRAIAAVGVMTGHIFGRANGNLPGSTLNTFGHRALLGGGYGVYLFFALTGYLLFWPFARQWFGSGTPIELKRYALNRAVRILPLYWAVLTVLLIAQHGGGTFDQWWRFLTFSENFSTHTVITVDGVMWSLAVEVEFYILLPVLAWLLAKLARNSRVRAAGALIVLGAISYLVRRHAFAGGERRILLELSLPATFMYFVPGMLLALIRLEWDERRPSFVRGVLARGDAWLLAAVGCVVWQFYDYSNLYAIALASFLTIGACVLPLTQGRLGRLLDWRPLAALGVASYSLYLWHPPIVIWCLHRSWLPHAYAWQLLIVSPIVIAVALVSYRVIESPFLRLRRQWTSASAITPSERLGAPVAPLVAEPAPESSGTAAAS